MKSESRRPDPHPAHPGGHLLKALGKRTHHEFARAHGLDPDLVLAIVEGRKAIDDLWDRELASALDTPVGHWRGLQRDYDAGAHVEESWK